MLFKYIVLILISLNTLSANSEALELNDEIDNNIGFINWPDFQGRIFKRVPHVRWSGKVHEKLTGSDKIVGLPPDVSNGLWHIKNLKKQDRQNSLYDTIV